MRVKLLATITGHGVHKGPQQFCCGMHSIPFHSSSGEGINPAIGSLCDFISIRSQAGTSGAAGACVALAST